MSAKTETAAGFELFFSNEIKVVEPEQLVWDCVIAFLAWTLFQIVVFALPLKQYFPKDPNSKKAGGLFNYVDTCNRIVSIVHGWWCIGGSGYYLKKYGLSPCDTPVSQIEYYVTVVSTGYFAYDFFCMAYFGLLDFAMFLHHFAAVFGAGFGLYQNASMTFWMGVLMAGECSNTPMHGRVILRSMGLRHTKLYNLLENLYFRLYFVGRMGYAHVVMYDLLQCPSCNIIVKASTTILIFQSYYFMYQMMFIMRRNN